MSAGLGHINNIVAKALQRNSTFFRGFVSRNLNLCRKAFVTYIRPLLEYNQWRNQEIWLGGAQSYRNNFELGKPDDRRSGAKRRI